MTKYKPLKQTINQQSEINKLKQYKASTNKQLMNPSNINKCNKQIVNNNTQPNRQTNAQTSKKNTQAPKQTSKRASKQAGANKSKSSGQPRKHT